MRWLIDAAHAIPEAVRPMIRAARVLVDGSSSREFDYSIPDTLRERVVVGARVRVSLRNRKSTGTVADIVEHSQAEADRMLRRWAQLLVKAMDKAHGRG